MDCPARRSERRHRASTPYGGGAVNTNLSKPDGPAEPRRELIVRASDFIDLQAGFRRVDRPAAEEILDQWHLVGDLTRFERVEILIRYDSPST
jgi:hypothetical protein